ncbi:MAG TPA: hypothetical protein VFJ90_10500 [Candidatus Didemnitutus sp.]|nr:hypothetical protein [Candidatus Didemnitutus sp.]
MKTSLRFLLGFVLVASLAAAVIELPAVSFTLGPSRFRQGDQIVIDQVLASSPKFELGDRVMVRGHYVLTSESKASISLFLTHTEDRKREFVAPEQSAKIMTGEGRFELAYDVKYPGVLHVSFYRASDGQAFGGVYFGTAAQMAEIKDWKLADYPEKGATDR